MSSFRTDHDKKKIGEWEGEKEHVGFPSVHVPPGGRWLLVIMLWFFHLPSFRLFDYWLLVPWLVILRCLHLILCQWSAINKWQPLNSPKYLHGYWKMSDGTRHPPPSPYLKINCEDLPIKAKLICRLITLIHVEKHIYFQALLKIWMLKRWPCHSA